jgi:hypothetical protein
MSSQTPEHSPGFWRRIKLQPAGGLMRAGLEDDFHRFLLQLTHTDGTITGLETRAERYPWSACPDAGNFLAEQAIGKSLAVVASLDPHSHCTHLFELLVLCAGHAVDSQPIQFDIRVPDRQHNRTCATLSENRSVVLCRQSLLSGRCCCAVPCTFPMDEPRERWSSSAQRIWGPCE